ncbi:hypothetical protein CLV78_108174 [Aliiruegeria haliotis]|uniref:Uncharacterized protein n=1 Tax=Aliiruegeria haliotis TaxID=1280846 RepID=A0A2T0RL92_9RHOB|nr:hypothetical protein [Aliiruegeria haliotis]PRY21901.1 hypothetical protein CLV78_108174 [Aliiruegeria haliotis]
MLRTLMTVGLMASLAAPALAGPTQLERAAGVEPGAYSIAQLVKLKALRTEGGKEQQIERILNNPQGDPLVARLSTTGGASPSD